jgi:hypothetical protein
MSVIRELNFFLGFQINQLKEGTFIHQEKYTNDILKKFKIDDCKPIKTPMPTNGHLDLDEGGKTVDQKLYRSMIGSLLYLTASMRDIMFSVCMCARFQANPKESHLSSLKRILRYLKYTPSIGLWYPHGACFELLGYSDSDFARCRIDRKSTSGCQCPFKMSMIGELNLFLGFQIKRLQEGTFIHHEKYTNDILKKFKMDDCKPIKTPMPTNGHLDLDEGGKPVDQNLYHSMIGSLLYLTASMPDIMLSVCMCARFQANPKESHLSALKRILRYLKYTPSIGLWYPHGACFELLGYSDSDFAGCRIDRNSTSGGCNLLGRSLVAWSSKKQNSVALSTAEAEYISTGACCAQILYMKQSLLDYGVVLDRVPLLCDNESAVKIANKPVQHSRTKHIGIRHHFLRDHVAKGDIVVCGVRSEEQLEDIFTKPLDENIFCRLQSELNVLDASNIM